MEKTLMSSMLLVFEAIPETLRSPLVRYNEIFAFTSLRLHEIMKIINHYLRVYPGND